jgi:hypothetical protein
MIDNTVEKYMSKSVDALKTVSLPMFDINIKSCLIYIFFQSLEKHSERKSLITFISIKCTNDAIILGIIPQE